MPWTPRASGWARGAEHSVPGYWIYLDGYTANLGVGGQVVSFMTAHLGYPIPSPAILEKIGTRFRRLVRWTAREGYRSSVPATPSTSRAIRPSIELVAHVSSAAITSQHTRRYSCAAIPALWAGAGGDMRHRSRRRGTGDPLVDGHDVSLPREDLRHEELMHVRFAVSAAVAEDL